MAKAWTSSFGDGFHNGRSTSRRNCGPFLLLLLFLTSAAGSLANAQVTAVTLQSPQLSLNSVTNLVSPVHFQATAEDANTVTGYQVLVDEQTVYRNFGQSVDAWITLPPGQHAVYVKATDSQSALSTPTYQINISEFSPPAPPPHSHRFLNVDAGQWTVDNNPDVGGNCNDGSLRSFASESDPNTRNSPARSGGGQHFVLTSTCQYDDSLFYWKNSKESLSLAGDTNFLWDFWFYVPTTTRSSTVQAFEFDLFQAVQLGDGVHEFMFGSQCNYEIDQWQFWLPQGSRLGWVSSGISSCRQSTGQWHHAIYFLQRVTPSGFQEIPKTFNPSTDTNTSLRFGTLSIDGQTWYLGGVAWSTIPSPSWSPVVGVQHQLDSAAAGIVIEQYADGESVTSW